MDFALGVVLYLLGEDDENLAGLFDVLIGEHGFFGGQAFEGATDIEGFFQIAAAERGHEAAAAGVDVDQAFGGEQLDGAAHGGEADSKLGGEFLDVEAHARREAAIEDGFADGLMDIVDGAAAFDFSQGDAVNVHFDTLADVIPSLTVGVRTEVRRRCLSRDRATMRVKTPG